MASFADKLTPLQREVLQAFFRHERRFFLTGGAALAGFHLGHRVTDDLDLFTHERDAFDTGARVLDAVAEELGARLAVRQVAPAFQRQVMTRGDESLVIDLVWERVPSANPDKLERAGIRIDPLEEILINKLTTVVSRAEERDLVDLLYLERAGLHVESALEAALAKDGGCTPATLAWVLSQIEIRDGAGLPGGVQPAELRSFLADLIKRLLVAAAPEDPPGPHER